MRVWGSRFLIVSAMLCAIVGMHVSDAFALQNSEELIQLTDLGTGAGQLENVQSVATDPSTGDIYVAQNGFGSSVPNDRINEFTPWGEFIKATGWNVAPGAVNEYQEIRLRGTSGEYALSVGGETTLGLSFNAGAAPVQAALEALSSIGPGNVAVRESPGTTDGHTPFVLRMTFIGAKAGTDIPQVLVATSDPALSVGSRTLADGAPAGVGLESCTAESGCRAAEAGTEPGQISFDGLGVAVAPDGDVYLREQESNRVQKFSSSGEFLLMFGPSVDMTTGANVCSAADVTAGDRCGAGSVGSGPGEFSGGQAIAVTNSGDVVLSDGNRLLDFEPSGAFKGERTVPGASFVGLGSEPAGGGIYAADRAANDVRVFGPSFVEERSCSSLEPEWVTGGAMGTFYVSEHQRAPSGDIVREAAQSCAVLSRFGEGEPNQVEGGGEPHSAIRGLSVSAAGTLAAGYAFHVSTTFSAALRTFGTPPVSYEAPPLAPPTITAQFATAVGATTATVGAVINPHYWADTRFYVEYGTGECSAGECGTEAPLPPGQLLTAKVTGQQVRSTGIPLEGLQPMTTYHYRVVARSTGGGPTLSAEGSFSTFPPQLPQKASCPNQAFRVAVSAPLPDCRAFEMISPVDKQGGDIKALLDFFNYSTALDQSAVNGQRFTFSSYRAFSNPQAAPIVSQYLAFRSSAGWFTQAISPPQGRDASELFGGANLDNEYKGFTGDLCKALIVVAAEPLLAAPAKEGYSELYQRKSCGTQGYEALIGIEPAGIPLGNFDPEPQGSSSDGSATVFRANAKLTPDAASSGISQAYYSSGGAVHLVCVLPSGTPTGETCSAGTYPGVLATSGPSSDHNHVASVNHALSDDGSTVYWTSDLPAEGLGPDRIGSGHIYVRVNPGEEQSVVVGGVCTESGKACTLPVSETKSALPAHFLDGSADGSKAIYEFPSGTLAGNMYEFDRESQTSTLIAKKTVGLVGAAEDLSHIYFVSEEKLAGTTGAVAKQPNLYLDEEGTNTFIAVLSQTDVTRDQSAENASIPSDSDSVPIYHAARASADGTSLAFISTANLTGYDNTDQASRIGCGQREGGTEGICDSEVYVYRAGYQGPVCISCNPSGAQPEGRSIQVIPVVGAPALATAATLALPKNQLYSPRVINSDGSRVFFDSFDSLVPRDTNRKADVYEWESAGSASECEAAGAELYVASAGGCLSLISSGSGAGDASFVDASESGDDAFFTTEQGLLPQDPGQIDIYDARVGGGFDSVGMPRACEGEFCQVRPARERLPEPSSDVAGPGNPAPPKCAKGRHRVVKKSNARCVKNGHKKSKHHHKKGKGKKPKQDKRRGASR